MGETCSFLGEKAVRICRRENSLCQNRDFKLCGIFEKRRIKLGGVDGSQIALESPQDMRYYISRLELLVGFLNTFNNVQVLVSFSSNCLNSFCILNYS